VCSCQSWVAVRGDDEDEDEDEEGDGAKEEEEGVTCPTVSPSVEVAEEAGEGGAGEGGEGEAWVEVDGPIKWSDQRPHILLAFDDERLLKIGMDLRNVSAPTLWPQSAAPPSGQSLFVGVLWSRGRPSPRRHAVNDAIARCLTSPVFGTGRPKDEATRKKLPSRQALMSMEWGVLGRTEGLVLGEEDGGGAVEGWPWVGMPISKYVHTHD
jgi:hypothetical protein